MLKLDLPDGLTGAGPADWRLLADITAEAFAEDPVTSFLFPKQQAKWAMFAALAQDVYSKRGICYRAGNDGATMWLPPGVTGEMSTLASLKMAARVVRHEGVSGIKRATEAGETMARHHPKTPHMYLFTIGVCASARGTGLGRQLMAPMLAACDASGLAVYLENSNPANHGFYSSFGFKRLELFEPVPGAPVLEAMWRDPTG